MTIEQRVKEMILLEHKTLKDFASKTDLPYGTIDGMLRRGFKNSSADNVFKLCKKLGISADELGKDKIVPVEKTIQRRLTITEMNDIMTFTKRNIGEYHDLTIDGEIMTEEELNTMIDAMELTLELIRRKRNREKE